MSSSLFLRAFILAVCCSTPLCAWSQSDSVTSGRSRGNASVRIGNGAPGPSREPRDVSLVPLLDHVLMQSTAGLHHLKTSWFGPYVNRSSYPVLLTFTHVGGSRHRFINLHINGVVSTAKGGELSRWLRPGDTFQWEVLNEHRITAEIQGANTTLTEIGLPSARDFTNPRRLGKFVGVISTGGSAQDESGNIVGGPTDLRYFYEPSQLSDGSNVWGDAMSVPSLGVVVEGPPPESASW